MIPLNETFDHYRPVRTKKGAGYTQTFTLVDNKPCRINQPSSDDQAVGAKWQAVISATLYTDPKLTPERGDLVECRGERFTVLGSVVPSIAIYRKWYLSEVKT
jgi:hypothetical protein